MLLSRALVASSNRRMRGLFRMVRASATRCFSPPLSMRPRSPTTVSYPSGIAKICAGSGESHAIQGCTSMGDSQIPGIMAGCIVTGSAKATCCFSPRSA